MITCSFSPDDARRRMFVFAATLTTGPPTCLVATEPVHGSAPLMLSTNECTHLGCEHCH